MQNKRRIFGVYLICGIGLLLSYNLLAQGARNMGVRLPVAARAGAEILEPGLYQLEIQEQSGGQAIIKFRKPGSAEVLASVKAVLTPAPGRAERNAVKVLFREGNYYLDKLLVSGEDNLYQFRP